MTGELPAHVRLDAHDLAGRPWTVSAYGLRFAAEGVPDLLASMATDGVWGNREVAEWARQVRFAGELDGSDPVVNVPALAALANLMAGRPDVGANLAESADLHQAVRMMREAGRHTASKITAASIDLLDAQTNLALRRIYYVERILPDLVTDKESRWMIETELLHPVYGRPGSTSEDWLRSFNRLFTRRGLQTIDIEPGDGEPFNRIVSGGPEPAVPRVDGPLVSVIMSAYKPDRGLFSAIRSITAQTWGHLELFVVDDCSPPEYQPILDEAAALDPRITVLRMPENGGTYKIRNRALQSARGEFIAFQDSDDWSHPERIEQQLLPLLNNPELVASLSRAVRVDEQLGANKVGFRALRQNASSLLFRREPVLARLGRFDTVRKAADSEFAGRIETVFGKSRIIDLELPLALVHLTHGSLSRSDFRFGWHDGNRVAYREAYGLWHSRITQGLEPALLDNSPQRKFPAPEAFLGRGRDIDRECEVLIVSDWHEDSGRYVGATDEVAALAEAQVPTVVIQMEAIRHARRRREGAAQGILKLRASANVGVARWEDQLSAGIVLVRDPELLTYFRPAETVGIRADTVVLYAAQPANPERRGGVPFHPVAIETNARAVFGVDPVWQPATAEVAASLRDGGAMGQVLEPRRLGVQPLSRRHYQGLRGENRPIVGTTGLDPNLTAPRNAQRLLQLLPRDSRFDVRVRDEQSMLKGPQVRRSLAPGWLVSHTEELESFLAEIDVFVGLPPRLSGVESVHEITLAIAHGCVAVLDPAYEPEFGEGALYATADSLPDVIEGVVTEPGGFARQQGIGYAWCESVLSGQAFVDSLASLASLVDLSREKIHS
ncbi:MAG: hypothetical protein JWR83_1149 [Aeromicrobium sp.]|nr:hypothetical protein [Aeromicrobium sp.]